MEDNGHKYLVKMSKFRNTMNVTRKRSTGKAQKEVEKNFLSFFFKKIRSVKKPRYKLGDEIQISEYEIHFRKGNKSLFTSEVVEIDKNTT